MKHFEITICMGRTDFRFCCTSSVEAFDAVRDTRAADNFLDDILETIVRMKKGEVLMWQHSPIMIRMLDGEV